MKNVIAGVLIVGGLLSGVAAQTAAEVPKEQRSLATSEGGPKSESGDPAFGDRGHRVTELATPIVEGAPGGWSECHVVNVSAEEVRVLVEQVNGFGAVVSSYVCPLPPRSDGPGCIVSNASNIPYYCRFTFAGAKERVRASMHLTLAGALPTVVPAE